MTINFLKISLRPEEILKSSHVLLSVFLNSFLFCQLDQVGVNADLCDFIDAMALDKEQREYIRHLAEVQGVNHVETFNIKHLRMAEERATWLTLPVFFRMMVDGE